MKNDPFILRMNQCKIISTGDLGAPETGAILLYSAGKGTNTKRISHVTFHYAILEKERVWLYLKGLNEDGSEFLDLAPVIRDGLVDLRGVPRHSCWEAILGTDEIWLAPPCELAKYEDVNDYEGASLPLYSTKVVDDRLYPNACRHPCGLMSFNDCMRCWRNPTFRPICRVLMALQEK